MTCRACSWDLFPEPLLRFENMPAVAQKLPSEPTDQGITLEIRQCSRCGLVQIPDEPVVYYRDVIRASGLSDEMVKFRRKQFADFVDYQGLRGKRVLEVGCGRGEYLKLLAACGVEACGIEHDEDAALECRAAGLEVTRDFIDGPRYLVPRAPFDAFLMLSVLEHWPSPSDTLMGLAHNLNDGAVGIVEVPNFDMIMKDGLFTEFMRDHLMYFTERTLTTTLERNGFEVLGVRQLWNRYVLSATVKKRTPIDMRAMRLQERLVSLSVKAFLARFERVAVWGAGHQALAAIQMLGISGKLAYVVDSAPFKQGRWTPASHVPIVHPDALYSEPVEAVLVIAAGYSDEVARIVREKHKDVKVAILGPNGVTGVA